MASFIYNSFWEDLATGAIDLDTDTIKVILTTSSYSENKDTHTKRSDVTNELSTANGYTAGGETVAVTIAKNTTTDTITYTFAAAPWATSTITARKAVYYKSRGGASSADELIAINDFGTNVSSTGGTFTVNASTITVNN
jgi:predicted DsbA family dithiol-disulfide isomerase